MGRVTPTAPESTPAALRGPRGQVLALAPGAPWPPLPGVVARVAGVGLGDVVAPVVFGFAILGSAFLLAWAAEALQLDVSQGLALTVLALIAVLPEYAVDFTFAYKAGEDPEKYAPLALANMTGGNRLLIGIGWSMVVLLAAWRMTSIARKRGYTGELDTDVHARASARDRDHVPRARDALLADAAVQAHAHASSTRSSSSRIFVVFVFRLWRAPAEEPHLVGPARLIGALPTTQRRIVVGVLLAYAAAVIFLCAEPFAESLVHLGEQAGIEHLPARAVGRAARVGGARAASSPGCSRGGSTRAPGSARCCRRR